MIESNIRWRSPRVSGAFVLVMPMSIVWVILKYFRSLTNFKERELEWSRFIGATCSKMSSDKGNMQHFTLRGLNWGSMHVQSTARQRVFRMRAQYPSDQSLLRYAFIRSDRKSEKIWNYRTVVLVCSRPSHAPPILLERLKQKQQIQTKKIIQFSSLFWCWW